MKFALDETIAGTMHYTPRRELHGEDPKPAATLVFDVELPASFLAMFSPTLRWSLYHNPNKTTNGGDSPVDDAYELRYPQWKNPIKWERDIIGGTLTIEHGIGDESDIVLPAKKVDDFQITPKEGGAFDLHFRVACLPDERQSGALAMMQDDVCEFRFVPPESNVGGDLADQAMREPAGAAA